MISIYPPVTINCTAWTVLPVEIQVIDNRLLMKELAPCYATAGASGVDLRAMGHMEGSSSRHMEPTEKMRLYPREGHVFSAGFALAIPPGYEGQIRPRSGLSRRGVVAQLGTIDSDYRGAIGITLFNIGSHAVEISAMDRIAQLVIAPVVRAELHVVDALPPTDRGSGGYGSTGVR